MPVHSTLRNSHEENLKHLEKLWPPAIPFKAKPTKKKKGKKDREADDEGEEANYLSFDVPLDPDDSDDEETVKVKVERLEDPTPEQWCEWRLQVQELIENLGYTDNIEKQVKIYKSLLRGKVLEDFQAAYRKHYIERDQNLFIDTEEDKREAFQVVLNSVALEIFPDGAGAIRFQKRYLRNNLYMGDMDPDKFAARLEKINSYLPFFPVEEPEYDEENGGEQKEPLGSNHPLPWDELVDIMDYAKSIEWHILMLSQGKKPHTFSSLKEATTYYKQLYESSKLQQRWEEANNKANGKGDGKTGKKRKGRGSPSNGPSQKESTTPSCSHCKKKGHTAEECWIKDPNKRPKKRAKTGNGNAQAKSNTQSTHVLITKQDLKKLVAQSQKKTSKGKRKRQGSSDDDSTSTSSTQDANNYLAHLRNVEDEGKHCHAACDSLSNNGLTSFCFTRVNDGSDREPDRKFSKSSSSSNKFSSESKFYTANPFTTDSDSRLPKRPKHQHYTAEVIVELKDRAGDLVPIRALLDTGTSESIVLKEFVQPGSASRYKSTKTEWKTMGGNFTTRRKGQVQFKFPELDTNTTITWTCHIDDSHSSKQVQYDMILGMDLMVELGIFINTRDKVIEWEDNVVPLKARGQLNQVGIEALYHMSVEAPILQQAEARQKRILDADYSKVDLQEFMDELTYLSTEERQQLLRCLQSHPTLFGGGLGQLNIKPVHLELKEGARPYHAKPYPIPKAYEQTTKKEIDRLCKIGVLERNHDSEWAAATFIQPKKTGDVRVLTDLRRLNAALKRKPYPLPKISDLLYKLQGFKYATAIDLSMGYYHIPLDEHSQKLCTTILPWGKYRYRKLPMGVSTAPDIFQSIIDGILGDLEFIRVYLDDILIISDGTFEDHITKLDIALERLEKAGFRANVRKCFFAKPELEYLGYWLTQDGIQPQPKKVEAILRLSEPKNVRQLRTFLGMVNYYRDMWRRRSHLLAPLTALLSKKKKWEWTPECQKSFEEMKKVMSQEALLAFPDFNKPFHIYTDASDYQLGGVIMQEGKPLAFYSRKLNGAQKRYTTGEQELLSIVETLKEFRSILLGQKLVVHTDHKNIIYGNLTNDRIARWRLLLEEFGPEYVHVAGKENVVADALSRMDQKDPKEPPQEEVAQVAAHCMVILTRNEEAMTPDELLENCYGSTKKGTTKEPELSELELEEFPMSPRLLAKAQPLDKTLMKTVEKSRKDFTIKTIEGQELLCHNGKILVPHILQGRIVAWTHQYLAHPGQERMEKTIGQLFTWPGMREQIRAYVKSCRQCQLCKSPSKQYGHLPPKQAEPSVPWNRVNVDLVGPYTVKVRGHKKKTIQLQALTMIDPTTGWFEIAAVDDATAECCMKAMDDTWINRYPRPQYMGIDGGSEFKSIFKAMCKAYGMTRKKTTSYNPQGNSIIERVHQVLGNMLRTFELEEQELETRDPFSSVLSAAAYAIRSTYHTTLEATPAELVFGRNMFLPVQFKADWEAIRARRQAQINADNRRENSRRIKHTYEVGELVAKRRPGILPKLSRRWDGPYTVTKVWSNGTVSISKGATTERLNIRRIKPYIDG